jgi:hypothetical protein
MTVQVTASFQCRHAELPEQSSLVNFDCQGVDGDPHVRSGTRDGWRRLTSQPGVSKTTVIETGPKLLVIHNDLGMSWCLKTRLKRQCLTSTPG